MNLSAYADGELDSSLRSAVEAALADSPQLRAELESWRQLRRTLSRVLASTTLPATLAPSLIEALRHERRAAHRHTLRLFAPLAAAAALVTIFIAYPYLRPAVPPPPGGAALAGLSPAGFFTVHQRCACGQVHDALGLHDRTPDELRRGLSDKLRFQVLLPDLRPLGYELAGACECFPRSGREFRVLHAVYRRSDGVAAPLSVFSLDCRVTLRNCKSSSCGERPRPAHEYTVTEEGDLRLVKWDEADRSYVLCSALPVERLYALADDLRVARRNQYEAEFASASRP